jgi:hypothetical protein
VRSAAKGDLSWAHRGDDREWAQFGAENAKNGNVLLSYAPA